MTVKHMPIAEFRADGWVQEINRRLLHPAGLALEVTVEDDGTERISGVWDCRDDPEGVYYDSFSTSDVARAEAIDVALHERASVRHKVLGYVIQPVVERTT